METEAAEAIAKWGNWNIIGVKCIFKESKIYKKKKKKGLPLQKGKRIMNSWAFLERKRRNQSENIIYSLKVNYIMVVLNLI